MDTAEDHRGARDEQAGAFGQLLGLSGAEADRCEGDGHQGEEQRHEPRAPEDPLGAAGL